MDPIIAGFMVVAALAVVFVAATFPRVAAEHRRWRAQRWLRSIVDWDAFVVSSQAAVAALRQMSASMESAADTLREFDRALNDARDGSYK